MTRTVAPRFSVVTVCFNAMPTLPVTLASLRAQTFSNYEWVVIDGGSTDGTAQWLPAQAPDRWVSQSDAGIYDAMNKGVQLARGEFIYFLNADDRFADDRVLADVDAALLADPATELLYGSAQIQRGDLRWRERYHWLKARDLPFGNLNHQAVFARKNLFGSVGAFDLRYRVIADLDWLIRVFRSPAQRLYIDRDVCHFDATGAHARQAERLLEERRHLQASYLSPWQIGWGNLRFRTARRLRWITGA